MFHHDCFKSVTPRLITSDHTKHFTCISLVLTLRVNTALWISDSCGKVRTYLLRSENSSVQPVPEVANQILLHATGDRMRGNLIKVSHNKIIITFTAPCQCCSPFLLQLGAFKLALSHLMSCYAAPQRTLLTCEGKLRRRRRPRKSQMWLSLGTS